MAGLSGASTVHASSHNNPRGIVLHTLPIPIFSTSAARTPIAWLARFMTSTVGETGADYVAANAGPGQGLTRMRMATLLGIALVLQLPHRAARAARNPVPMLIFTARNTLDDRLRGLDGGASETIASAVPIQVLQCWSETQLDHAK